MTETKVLIPGSAECTHCQREITKGKGGWRLPLGAKDENGRLMTMEGLRECAIGHRHAPMSYTP